MKEVRTASVDRLFRAIKSLDTEESFYDFFQDLCTMKEIEDMAQRLDTAILLKQGKNYQEIQKEVGTSSATVSRVNRCLQYGTGGYDFVISELQKRKQKTQ